MRWKTNGKRMNASFKAGFSLMPLCHVLPASAPTDVEELFPTETNIIMTTAIIFHEVLDGEVWSKAWQQGPGSRHELFGKQGIKCRTFSDPTHPNVTGLLLEIPDMEHFYEMLQSDEGKKAMREDGLKVETMRMLVEFTP